MVSKIEIISKNIEFWLFFFSSLNQSKNRAKDRFIRVKSALLISSSKISANFSISKTYIKKTKTHVKGCKRLPEKTQRR